MASRYLYGDTRAAIVPIATGKAVAIGDLVGLSSGTLVKAEDETWDTSLAVTQANFVRKFLGVSCQFKDNATARIIANGEDNVIRVNPDGVYEFDCASASFAVGDLVGPAKQSGNALESQKVVAVADESLAIGRVAEAASSATKVKVKLFSVLLPSARADAPSGPYAVSGTANGTGVSAVEYGNGVVHRTVLTLSSYSLTLTANGTSTAGGGGKIYDFPEGYLKVLGVTSNLTVTNAGGDGSFLASLGSVAAGTDGSLSSTEANICASTAATVSSGTGTCKMKGDTVSAVDGTSAAVDMYLNGALNADGTGKLTLVFTGTIVVTWCLLGDS